MLASDINSYVFQFISILPWEFCIKMNMESRYRYNIFNDEATEKKYIRYSPHDVEKINQTMKR